MDLLDASVGDHEDLWKCRLYQYYKKFDLRIENGETKAEFSNCTMRHHDWLKEPADVRKLGRVVDNSFYVSDVDSRGGIWNDWQFYQSLMEAFAEYEAQVITESSDTSSLSEEQEVKDDCLSIWSDDEFVGELLKSFAEYQQLEAQFSGRIISRRSPSIECFGEFLEQQSTDRDRGENVCSTVWSDNEFIDELMKSFAEYLQQENSDRVNDLRNPSIESYWEFLEHQHKEKAGAWPRRSSRVPLTRLKRLAHQCLVDLVKRSKHRDGLEVVKSPGKGRGVAVTRSFSRGEFLVEYTGELIDLRTAKQRELKYSKENVGCFMFYFRYRDVRYCIDATADSSEESSNLGRLINHSRRRFNCVTKIVPIDNRPRLIFVASRDLRIGEELLYDYGDRRRHVVESFPWLAIDV